MTTLLEKLANSLVNSFGGKDEASCFLALIVACIAMIVISIGGQELIDHYARKPYRHKGGLEIWRMNRNINHIFITIISCVIIFTLSWRIFDFLFNILL